MNVRGREGVRERSFMGLALGTDLYDRAMFSVGEERLYARSWSPPPRLTSKVTAAALVGSAARDSRLRGQLVRH